MAWQTVVIAVLALALTCDLFLRGRALLKGRGRAGGRLTWNENRRAFYELSRQEFERARRYDHPFTLGYFDLDDYKEVADRFSQAAAEEMLRLVPDELREASYALGVPKWKTIVRIVFPIAMPGIISGVLLSVARVIGETAPVLILVGYSRSINLDIFHGNMASLPLLIYTELTNPEHAGFLRVWGAALTLIIIVAAINLIAAAFRLLATLRR